MQTINLRDIGGQSGPDSGAPCSPWAKGGGLLCPACLEEIESEHFPLLKDCVHYPFPQCKEGRVVPLLWPRGNRVPQK